MSQRRRRYTPEWIIRKLREGEKLLGQHVELPEVCRYLEVTEATWYRWRNQYGGMKADDAKWLRDLERENARGEEDGRRACPGHRHAQGVEPGKLVSPDRRRRAVQVLQQRFGVSQCRACAVVGEHRSTQRLAQRTLSLAEEMIRARLRQIARAHPRWGWRKPCWLLRAEGQPINHKRIRRYWTQEGLTRPATTRKKQRVGPQRAQRRTVTAPDQVWRWTPGRGQADGRQIRFCNIVDEFTREALATAAARSFTADDTTILLDKIIAETGRRPAHLRRDNGPELTAAAMRDWCRFSVVGTAFIEPGSPWHRSVQETGEPPSGRARGARPVSAAMRR